MILDLTTLDDPRVVDLLGLARCALFAYGEYPLDPRSGVRVQAFDGGRVRGIDTQAVVVHDAQVAVLAFRGSSSPTDWINSFEFKPRPLGGALAGPGWEGHPGFAAAWAAVWPSVHTWLRAHLGRRTLWLTGHSLGGALATLSALALGHAGAPLAQVSLCTFGQPRVGNDHVQHALESALPDRVRRVVHRNDIVARIPPTQHFGYRHAGQQIHLTGDAVVVSPEDSLPMGPLLADLAAGLIQRPSVVKDLFSTLTGALAGGVDGALRSQLESIVGDLPRVGTDHLLSSYLRALHSAVPLQHGSR